MIQYWFSIKIYLSVITIFPVSCITNDLGSAIGQLYSVFTTGHISITGCLMIVIIWCVDVIDGICEIKWHSWFVHVIILRWRFEAGWWRLWTWLNRDYMINIINYKYTICIKTHWTRCWWFWIIIAGWPRIWWQILITLS